MQSGNAVAKVLFGKGKNTHPHFRIVVHDKSICDDAF